MNSVKKLLELFLWYIPLAKTKTWSVARGRGAIYNLRGAITNMLTAVSSIEVPLPAIVA
jgi:hypothetical protein